MNDTSSTQSTAPTMNPTTDTTMNNNLQAPPPANNMSGNTDSGMNNMNSSNMSTTSNSNSMSMKDSASNLVNPNNIPGQTDYASLPVMETYVPDDIVQQVKTKYPNQVVYDITAVKAPVDSSMMQNDSMAMNQNSMNQNNTAMNSDSTANSTAMNTTPNQNSMSMSQNPNNGMMANSNAQAPEKFDYVVRVIQGGQMTTEKLQSDGTALNVTTGNKNGWNQ